LMQREASEGVRGAVDPVLMIATYAWSELQQRRGSLTQQIETMSRDRRLAEKQLELDGVERQLASATRRWRVLAVTSLLLHAIRQTYERDRQPETLREASQYLARMTADRYRRIWTPLGEDALRVDEADGQSLSIEKLSRGTREQVFLSLRLALVAAYARRGIAVPLILDDVLVNFDSKRVEAAARLLKQFAADGHQLLVFTCHEHVAQVFRSLQVQVRELTSGATQFVEPEPIVEEEEYVEDEVELTDDDMLDEPEEEELEDEYEEEEEEYEEDAYAEDEDAEEEEWDDAEPEEEAEYADVPWEEEEELDCDAA